MIGHRIKSSQTTIMLLGHPHDVLVLNCNWNIGNMYHQKTRGSLYMCMWQTWLDCRGKNCINGGTQLVISKVICSQGKSKSTDLRKIWHPFSFEANASSSGTFSASSHMRPAQYDDASLAQSISAMIKFEFAIYFEMKCSMRKSGWLPKINLEKVTRDNLYPSSFWTGK